MKLRQKPEDFKVQEVLDLENILTDENSSEKNYKIYELCKKNMENLKAISYISKSQEIPLKEIGYCGLKDRHAITKQYISIPAEYEIDIKEDNLKLNFIGYSSDKLTIGDLIGNHFEITIRNIDRDYFLEIADNIRNLEYGVPNYFDNQRFGSVFQGKFIVEYMLKNNFEEIFKILLTKYGKSENKKIKDLKRYIDKNWNNWDKCYQYVIKNDIKSKMYVNILKKLKNTGEYREAYKYVDIRLNDLFIAAYQSYLWNECLKEYLKEVLDKENRTYIDYDCGSLLYYSKIDESLFEELRNKEMPLLYDKLDKNLSEIDEKFVNAINMVLKRNKLKFKDFSDDNLIKGKFRNFNRPILNIPENVKYGKFKADELNKGKYKITLEFNLKKGAYATGIIKGVFNSVKYRQ
ncbi:tRNA pseudouridine13 synthase [Methanococcus voltae PS]|uniref:tRNA pseudouridine13 synthase n=1 Tax=Methanococcus voltae PS TaxID=523842 RepID=A0ABT2EXJ2_METVO|nr:tRNA pseudouridine(13) synthase TruD [Methanococcus voltae]MCS3922688.1 tRNA pseudouridine13 synthase [Methanococcus voltae PS]